MIAYAVHPRDGFFCKDGRGWYTTESGIAHGHPWPPTTTLRGLLRGAAGRALEEREGRRLRREDWPKETAHVELGATLPLRRPLSVSHLSPEHRLWPAPADALWLRDRDSAVRLCPRPSRLASLGARDCPAIERLWRAEGAPPGKPRAGKPWWTEAAMVAWLRGCSVDQAETCALPVRRDIRLSIAPETQTAKAGGLFSHDIRETIDGDGSEWIIALESSAEIEHNALLGSERRFARVERIDGHIFDRPEALPSIAGGKYFRLIAVTPARFAAGWLPDGLLEHEERFEGEIAGIRVTLRAAMVPRALHLSAWDQVAWRPRPTRRLVPPGSVYFFEAERPLLPDDIERLWLVQLGSEAQEGFGRFIIGAWHGEDET